MAKDGARNYSKLSNSYLKSNGYDAEDYKEDFVGSSGGSYDMYLDKKSGEIILINKTGRSTIRTGDVFIEKSKRREI